MIVWVTHNHFSETCDGRWHKYSVKRDLAPNASRLVQKVVRDWRWRFHIKPGFTEHVSSPLIEFSISWCYTVATQRDNDQKKQRWLRCSWSFLLYLPSQRIILLKTLLSSTHCLMRCFNSQSVKDIIGLDRGVQKNDGGYALASNTVDSTIQNSRVFQMRFKQSCSEALSEKHNTAKELCFSYWGMRLCIQDHLWKNSMKLTQ